jgi:hypothetical protein
MRIKILYLSAYNQRSRWYNKVVFTCVKASAPKCYKVYLHEFVIIERDQKDQGVIITQDVTLEERRWGDQNLACVNYLVSHFYVITCGTKAAMN